MVEELREREASVVQPGPIQVAQDQALLCFALSCFDECHLCGKILPAVAVVDESVDPLPELCVHRIMEFPRSEEHTSELQSRFDLVCRLLLEKKKKKTKKT